MSTRTATAVAPASFGFTVRDVLLCFLPVIAFVSILCLV
jgi:hypothetical protein